MDEHDSSVLSACSHFAMRPTNLPLGLARSFERPTDHGASAPPIVSISCQMFRSYVGRPGRSPPLHTLNATAVSTAVR